METNEWEKEFDNFYRLPENMVAGIQREMAIKRFISKNFIPISELKRWVEEIEEDVKENPGGKFWCWHDYTCFGPQIRSHIHDWGYIHKCIKCGKSKVFKEMQIEPVLSKNLNK